MANNKESIPEEKNEDSWSVGDLMTHVLQQAGINYIDFKNRSEAHRDFMDALQSFAYARSTENKPIEATRSTMQEAFFREGELEAWMKKFDSLEAETLLSYEERFLYRFGANVREFMNLSSAHASFIKELNRLYAEKRRGVEAVITYGERKELTKKLSSLSETKKT